MNSQRPSDASPSRSPDLNRSATPWPPFDLQVFARDSERKFRAAEAVERSPTAPPPPLHPASMTAPKLPSLRIGGPSSDVDERLAECAARVRPLLAQLRSGGISREETANVLRLELCAIEEEARAASSEPLAVMIAGLRDVVEELGGIAGYTHCAPLEVIVVDDDAPARERVALAAESLGHSVRSAPSLEDMARIARHRAPDAVLVVATMQSDAPSLCRAVRDRVKVESLRVAAYSTDPAVGTSDIARATGTPHCFKVPESLDSIAAQLTPILDDLAW